MKTVHRNGENADKLETRQISWNANDNILNYIEKDNHRHGIELHFIK